MFYLLLTIGFEILGTFLLKLSDGMTHLLPAIGAGLAYVCCYVCFARALTFLPLSLAYATWAGVGIFLSTLASVYIFSEKITGPMVFGILCVTVGVVVLNLSTAS